MDVGQLGQAGQEGGPGVGFGMGQEKIVVQHKGGCLSGCWLMILVTLLVGTFVVLFVQGGCQAIEEANEPEDQESGPELEVLPEVISPGEGSATSD